MRSDVLLLFVGLGLGGIAGYTIGLDTSHSDPAPSQDSSSETPSHRLEVASPAAEISSHDVEEKSWQYSNSVDKLTDKVTRTACTESTDKVHQNWPYTAVTVSLCLRGEPDQPTEAFFYLNGDGQILCGLNSCDLKVRFDDEPVSNYRAIGPNDNSTNILFIGEAQRFTKKISSAKTTLIDFTLYQSGNQAISFNTENLHWKEIPTESANGAK
jgi:hypothetical protein